jgi:uncharacterized protein
MLSEADDLEIRRLSIALRERRLPRCIDIRSYVEEQLPRSPGEQPAQRNARVTKACDAIAGELREVGAPDPDGLVHILIDQYIRHPYERYQESETPLNQILIRLGGGRPRDVGELSPLIAHAEPFNLCRDISFGMTQRWAM